MTHYFKENPTILTNEREITATVFAHDLRFLTNNGLFSCDKIDGASLALVQYMPPISGKVLDLGCGYGFIGIALAKKNDIILTQSDINSVALSYAVKNAEINGVKAAAIHSDSFAEIHEAFDVITLNPPIHAGKDIMYRLYQESAEHLSRGGSFFVVIHKKHGAESTVRKLNEIFGECEVYKKKGLFLIHATNSGLNSPR
ncbi:MAG: methyltransferase [Defluviitaleaceae bacterium]|nr:methyltransferase [Defluviitaleaceae bacterium]